MKWFTTLVLGWGLAIVSLRADTVFLEAEDFPILSDGWKVTENAQIRAASRAGALNGASGDPKGTARSEEITWSGDGQPVRVWVRYGHHTSIRGPFRVRALARANDQELGAGDFDLKPQEGKKDWEFTWNHFDIEPGTIPFRIEVSKSNQRNCSGYVRNVDCILITDDLKAVPDHIPHGPQTWMRVTLGEIYSEPVHVHIFADHYRSPWYAHWTLSKAGAAPGYQPALTDRLTAGEQTPWCNITRMLHEDSGAILNITMRHTYMSKAERLQAVFELASEPDDKSIVKRIEEDSTSNGAVIVVPPHLSSDENRERIYLPRDIAKATGKIADAYEWPTIGKKPERFPFLVSTHMGGYGTPVDQSIVDREQKTLDYFGFTNRTMPYLHGKAWRMKERSYCRPDLELMKKVVTTEADEFRKDGHKIEDVIYCMLTDEPTGQPLSFMAKDAAYQEAFRDWLKERLGKSPQDLLVEGWGAVRTVTEAERDEFPALYYFSQRFRTRALGNFMTIQKELIEQANGREFPTVVNFSDGAIYQANFYAQGVDYFELLDDPNQNAIWGEDWSNGASSYQCAAFNVDLMRAAARDRNQLVGHYLIAYANRKPWDTKTKAAGETARGVRMWMNYFYGPSWGTHNGGPLWGENHNWYCKPEMWASQAEVVREIGAVEDLLLDPKLKPAPAEVAILYSTSSDIWTVGGNRAFGFNRMHNWMALAHAQVPVDLVAGRQVVKGQLDGRKVCYLSGPNLSRAAAEKLRDWVRAGGTLILSAGAAERDEFNRPLELLDDILPSDREELLTSQKYLNSGSYLPILKPQDIVTTESGQTLEVLSVLQRQKPRGEATVLAKFADGSPATVRGSAGKGAVVSHGFLPALDYIKQAVAARQKLVADAEAGKKPGLMQGDHPAPPVEQEKGKKPTEPAADPRIERSYNPWDFSAQTREFLLQPVRRAGIDPDLQCDVPLIDAILLQDDSSSAWLIPLANHTLERQEKVTFSLRVGTRQVKKMESVYHSDLAFEQRDGQVRFSLSLDASDYVTVRF
ncbi:MAG: hypothetical protein P1U87_09255 [Verrucomicrobiales bacterium]|nr:hypothetical protein [Verrucomicrobiales bacterium]